MGLTWRFVALIAALMAAVAATTVAGLSAMERLDAALDRVVESDTPRLLAITHVRRLFRSMVVLERDFILAKDAKERTALERKAGALPAELAEQLETYARLAPADDGQMLTDIRGARDFRAPVVKPGALAARLERRWSLSPESFPAANTQNLSPSGRASSS